MSPTDGTVADAEGRGPLGDVFAADPVGPSTATAAAGPSAPAEPPAEGAGTADRPSWVVPGWIVAALVVLAAAGRMVGHVLGGTDLQQADYWTMLFAFTTADGGLDAGGLLEFQNHPVVLPQLAYWVNIGLFAGSNRALGIVVVLVVLATVGVLAAIARMGALRDLEAMAVVALGGVLLFGQNNAWNFMKAMSGTAWFTANLLVVLAVYLRCKDRLVPAVVVAVAATVTYGTGILVWPALVAVGVTRRPPREWWKELPHLAAAAVAYAWYRSGASENEKLVDGTAWDYLQQAARVYSYSLDITGTLGDVLGGIAVVGLPLLALWAAVKVRTPAVAAWVGIGAFSWLACMQITAGRGRTFSVWGDAHRYTSLGALGWVALAALAMIALRRATDHLAASGHRWASPVGRPATAVVVLVLPLLVVVAVGGSSQVEQRRREALGLDLAEIAWQYGFTDQAAAVVFFNPPPGPVTPRLRLMGHHPFVDGWDLDCGMRGRVLEGGATPGAGGSGSVSRAKPVLFYGGVVQIDGWVEPGADVACVVVTDPDGEVVGAGTPGAWDLEGDPGPRGSTAFRAIAPVGLEDYAVHGVAADGTVTLIDDDFEVEAPG